MRPRLTVIRSPYTGFCFGVKRAMRLIEQGLETRGGTIYTLGDVIHNPQTVDWLKNRGVYPVSSLDELEIGSTLVIRAHGVHPDLIEEAKRRGIELIDATCPFVQRSQHYARRLSWESYQVIIIGDARHPEVQGIRGYASGGAEIVDEIEEASRIGPLEKAGVVIQTTFSREKAMKIIEVLRERVTDLRVYDTICQATTLRREATLELAADVDVVLVVGGRESSNTKRLYQMCIDAGFVCHFIETADELDPAWFDACETVGITTGTSTPDWIVDEVLARLEDLGNG